MLVLTVLRAGLLPATPPNALPAGTLSDGTISSGGRSPSRQRRPHSVAGRLPNYASPTVASQCRMARGLEKTFAGNLTVCYRCSKFVSIPFLFYVILNTMFSCVMCLLASRHCRTPAGMGVFTGGLSIYTPQNNCYKSLKMYRNSIKVNATPEICTPKFS